MIKFLFVLVSMGLCTPCLAQQRSIDSLQKIVKSTTEDSTLVYRYKRLCYLYFAKGDMDSVDICAKMAVEIARRINWKQGEAQFFLDNARNTFFWANNYPKAFGEALNSLKIFEAIGDTVGMTSSLYWIGVFYKGVEDYNQSEIYCRRAYNLAKNLNNTELLFRASYNLANAYTEMQAADSSMLYFQECYQFANRSQSKERLENIAWALHGLGRTQMLYGNIDISISFFKKSIQKSQEIADTVAEAFVSADVYESLSLAYAKLNQDSAIYYARKCLDKAIPLKYNKNILSSYKQLALLYDGKHDDSSVKYFKLSYALRDSMFATKSKNEIYNITFNEEERQKELKALEFKYKQERSFNMQFAILGVGVVSFIILLLLLSQSIIVKSGLVKILGVIGLLLVFEFVNLLMHPLVGDYTHHSPIWTFLIMVCIAALLVPAHHHLEKWITLRLVEKNKRIRLAAAKKTIASLEKKE
jgi:tetratricopeptide (TPR) repeat protein